MQEETFGPVLPVAPFDNDDEAIRLANDSDFGLAASVWTGSRRRGEAMAKGIKAGTVMINDMISCFGIAEAPHGGFKQSGIGRTHGEMGLEEMVQVKYVDVDLLPEDAESLVVRIRQTIPATDGRIRRFPVCQQLGYETEGRAALSWIASAKQPYLTVLIIGAAGCSKDLGKADLSSAELFGEKHKTADPSPAELYPNKRKIGACRGPRSAGS